MNSELLQNSDVLVRLLILAVPTIVTFLFSIIFIKIMQKGANAPDDSANIFLSVCATSFFYMVMEVVLILFSENIGVEQVVSKTVVMFLMMGLLNALSCLAKGIIGGRSMQYVAGADKQSATSRVLIYMSIAEVPGLAALALYLLSFMNKGA